MSEAPPEITDPENQMMCPQCWGSGVIPFDNHTCPLCDGTGITTDQALADLLAKQEATQ